MRDTAKIVFPAQGDDPRPASRQRAANTVLVMVVVLLGGSVVLRAVALSMNPGSDGWVVLLGVGLGFLIAVLIFVWLARRMRRQLLVVSTARPGADLFLVQTTADLCAEAVRLGVSPRRISATGGDHAVVAVLPERVELWVRGDDGPRWEVSRSQETSVGTTPVPVGLNTLDQVSVSDGQAAIAAIPVGPHVLRMLSRKARQGEVARLVAAVRGS